MSHVVVKPLVVAVKPDGSHAYLYKDALLPSYVKGDALKAFVDEGFVAKSDAPEPTEENTAPEKPADKSAK